MQVSTEQERFAKEIFKEYFELIKFGVENKEIDFIVPLQLDLINQVFEFLIEKKVISSEMNSVELTTFFSMTVDKLMGTFLDKETDNKNGKLSKNEIFEILNEN